jgi:hypothetical protein
VVLLAAAPAMAVQVGWSVDVRQTQISPVADDYHIWGVLQSLPDMNGPRAPTLISSDEHAYPCDPNCQCGGVMGSTCHCGPLDNFSYQIGGTPNPNLPRPQGYVGPWPPVGGPFYYFEANWSSTQYYVGYNDWAHFGLKFDENQANYGYWLQGKWTAGNGAQYAEQNTPIASFEVVDGPSGYLRLQNGFNPEPPGPTPVTLGLSAVQLAALPVGTNFDIDNLTNSFFDIHTEITWSANPIGPTPQYIAPSSFFDVFLESVAVPGAGGQTFANLLPGQLLLARQQFTYPLVGGGTETFWEYQMHEVPLPVPEPSTIVMFVLMVGGLLAWWRRR